MGPIGEFYLVADLFVRFACRQPLTSPGRWLALVDFAAKEEPNPFETNLTLKLKPRHGSLGATLLEGRAAFDVSERSAAAPPEPAEAPKLAPSGASRFRGVVINSTDIFIDPIKIDDLSSERPTTANAEGTFLTTFRTNPAVVNPNSCATAVLEFFTSSNGTWVPLDLTALYGQATHLISTHSSLLHASHAHAYPWPQFLDAPNQFGITFDKSLVPNACNGDAGSHGHAPNWIAPASFPGKLIAPIRFGPAGSYAVFTQAAAMIGGEKVMLAPRFVVSVGSGKESTTGAVAPLAGLSSAGVVPPPFSESQAQPQGAPVAAIVGTLIGLLVMVLLLGLGMFWYRRRRHPVAHDTAFSKSDKAAEGEYVELEAASQAVQERNVV